MKEQKKFDAEISKVLKMMIHSVYTNKDIFLRELISNGVDAIEKRRYLALQNEQFAVENGEYGIDININTKDNTISITDNGIGMNLEDMIANLGTIAKSGTEEFVKNLASKEVDLIGQFGVGFYSVFMVADSVKVISKKIGSEQAYSWESNGEDSYSVEEHNEACKHGTTITAYIKEDDIGNYLNKYKISNIIETYSNNVGVKINLECDGEAEKITLSTPIWHRDKKSVTEDEYRIFYKSVSHLPDKPFITMHYHIEGNVEFRALLFIPSMKPFDLFHPDRQTRVKLYVKKVFISEADITMMPKYFRFIQGVIDSNDLPLNISRETLQDSAVLSKIQDVLMKKIISEIKQKSKEDPEGYVEFWKNFGAVIKEGLCESWVDRDGLFEICRFYSSKSDGKLISIMDYISRLKDDQDIYYCIGDNYDDLMSNPQMEIMLKKDIEVLLLTDSVDSFWVNVVHDYSGKNLKSISQEDLKIESNEEEKPENTVNQNELIASFTDALKGKVKEVSISHKLVESPACLAVGAGAMDIKMERFLIEQNQLHSASLKVLEINPNNPLVLRAFEAMKSDEGKKHGQDMAVTIFEMACVAQGETIHNPAAFIKKINSMLQSQI